MQKKTKKKEFFVFIGILSLLWTASLILNNPNRFPASIEKTNYYDFSQLSGPGLALAIEKRVAEDIRILPQNDNYTVAFHQFDINHDKTFCEHFDQVKLTFEAEGMATAGDRPSMSATYPCENKAISNFVIPFKEIKSLKAQNMDWRPLNSKTQFTFRAIPDQWPEYWVLHQVDLQHESQFESDVKIERHSLYKLSKNPLNMDWERK